MAGNQEASEKEWEEVRTVLQKLRDRINGLQTTAFQLANFYFTSQAVVFTALTGASSSLKCRDVWFPLILSLLPGALNLYALYKIGKDYIRAVILKTQNTRKKDRLWVQMVPVATGTRAPSAVIQKAADVALKKRLNSNLWACMIAFAIFAIVIAFGSVWLLCGETTILKHQDDANCVKLCDGSKCIRICPDS